MPTRAEVLADKGKYPDDMEIDIAGVKTTLGELRSEALMRSDYTQKTQALAREREDFSREKSQWQASADEAKQQLNQLAERIVAGQRPAQQTTQDDVLAMMERDPVAKRLMDRIAAAESKIEERSKELAQANERLRAHETTYMADQHRRVLAQIRQSDPKAPTDDDIVRFAQQNYIPRLDMAYKLLTEERRMEETSKAAAAKAAEEAYERGKREAMSPVIPQNRRVIAPTPAEKMPTWDDAYNDPDVLAAMDGRQG